MYDLYPFIFVIIFMAFVIYKFRMWNQKRNETIVYLANIKSELLNDIHTLKDLEKTTKKKSNQPSKDELIATLNWLHQINAIDHNEYNTLYLKSLPYTKG